MLEYKRAAEMLERLNYFLVLARDLGILAEDHSLFARCSEIGRILHSSITRFSKEFG